MISFNVMLCKNISNVKLDNISIISSEYNKTLKQKSVLSDDQIEDLPEPLW